MDQLDLDFAPQAEANQVSITAVSDAEITGNYSPPARYSTYTGSKFVGGFGDTQIVVPDYWTLRTRSSQLFETNLFARGIVRRLVTNIIVDGLHPEASPDESLLGLEDNALEDWTEDVERRFSVWAQEPYLCDTSERRTFGQIQAQAELEALVEGDVLVTTEISQTSRTTRVRLTPGSAVQTPWKQKATAPNKIVEGVEVDPQGRHVAFWVRQGDGSFKRLPAWGEKSGRRIAWLVYGTDKRESAVRGQPLLALVLQSLQEIDKYRDSATRKALLNSILALFVTRSADSKVPSGALGNSATRAQQMRGAVSDSPTTEDNSFTLSDYIPGLIIDRLGVGEEIHAHGAVGTDEKYGDFEAAIIQGIAWALEIPPSILRLSFNANYSASKGEINEFELFLHKQRAFFNEQFCRPHYAEWLMNEVLKGQIKAPGLLDAYRDPSRYTELGAWLSVDFSCHIKPPIDPNKMMAGYEKMVEMGVSTRSLVCRQTTGRKYSQVVKQLARENRALVEAMRPLLELEALKSSLKTVDPSLFADSDEAPESEEDSDEAPTPKRKSS